MFLYNMYRAASEGALYVCVSASYARMYCCVMKNVQPKCSTFSMQQKCLAKLLALKFLWLILTALRFIIL